MISQDAGYLLIQSCSARKHQTDQPVPALDLYDGYFYRIIKNSRYGSGEGVSVDLRIISAEHGLLHPNDEITTYDRRMDEARAAELRADVVDALATDIKRNEYDEIIVNLGKTYREAISGLAEAVDTPVVNIEGSGIGEKGHVLKQFLEGDTSPLRGDC